jgi:hypothetical protein
MHSVLARSFGGLAPRYYIRQLLFGLFFPVFLLLMHGKGVFALPVQVEVFIAVNTLLYPYSRFVYESVAGYIVGDNVFVFPATMFGTVKIFTMLFCWVFAIVVAPIGLVWLYFHNGR